MHMLHFCFAEWVWCWPRNWFLDIFRYIVCNSLCLIDLSCRSFHVILQCKVVLAWGLLFLNTPCVLFTTISKTHFEPGPMGDLFCLIRSHILQFWNLSIRTSPPFREFSGKSSCHVHSIVWHMGRGVRRSVWSLHFATTTQKYDRLK